MAEESSNAIEGDAAVDGDVVQARNATVVHADKTGDITTINGPVNVKGDFHV